MMARLTADFWGKARSGISGGPNWHPLVWHLLDVAASAKALFAARPRATQVFAEALGTKPEEAARLGVLLAAFHDLGKFAPAFQRKADGPPWPFAYPRDAVSPASEHDRDGLLLWRQVLSGEIAPRIWVGGHSALETLIAASTGHHGRALGPDDRPAEEVFRPEGLAAARDCVQRLVEVLLPAPLSHRCPSDVPLGAASFWFAGFVTIADWAGSTRAYFAYRSPDVTLADYWDMAQASACRAITALGLESAKPSTPRSFSQLTGKEEPTPLQDLAARVDLGYGPVLVIAEDVTGAGKSEAAQILVHRLMTAGRAAGAYWAMPTQATANAMYERQRHALAALFSDNARPQLALAHGGARLHEGFQETILREAGESGAATDHQPLDPSEEAASAMCAAFIADDARAALIADIGAGTVDQAMLGVLPARFQAVRLFGLSDKVLVVDEAHAYDAYMSEELRGLLKFHAALAGSAVVLSATLPRDVKKRAGREQLVRAWMEGSGARMNDWLAQSVVQQDDYPLVTIVEGRSSVREYPVAAARWSRRQVPVRFVSTDEQVLHTLAEASHQGCAVAWVRNTVDDALEAAAALSARGIDPIVFHARFAQIDRQRIEGAVLERVGPTSTPFLRRGVVVVATQVIEQSLDLDFDVMASDLAPIDLLIQRAGRLRRHSFRDGSRPSAGDLWVRAPLFSDHPEESWLEESMRRTAFVYRDPAVLWRTMRVLLSRGAIETPDGLRGLVEAVYGPDAEVPQGLVAKSLKSEGIAGAHGAQARYGLLSLTDGYRADRVSWVGEDRVHVHTRLGEAQTILRLARVDTDGRLVPWAGEASSLAKRWSLSEVKVAARRVPPGSSVEPKWAQLAASAKADWGARERERADVLLLPLESAEGRWRGALIDANGGVRLFSYAPSRGLELLRSRENFARIRQ
jgi:CRISPR-associated endonuclease/helicase Cas3